MLRIGFSGVPGTGKTLFSRSLAAKCWEVDEINNVEVIQEYARRYIHKHGSIDNIWEQYRILEKQLEWESSAANDSLDLLITDGPIFLGFAYCVDIKNNRDSSHNTQKELMVLSDLFKKFSRLNETPRYDIIFHIVPNSSTQDLEDGLRPEFQFGEDWRNKMNNRIKAAFDVFPPVKFVEIEAIQSPEDLDLRVKRCMSHVKEML